MYDIYTTEEFQEKATEKFKNIYLDNKKLDGEENVIVCWEKGYIKATAFIEIIGGKNIKWNNEYRSISFELNGKEIEYFTDSKYCVEKYGAEFKYYYIFINGVPYTDTYCSLPSIFINDYIYFNEDDVEMFLKNLTEKQIMKDKTNQDIFITTN
jgi:hypothetical protein